MVNFSDGFSLDRKAFFCYIAENWSQDSGLFNFIIPEPKTRLIEQQNPMTEYQAVFAISQCNNDSYVTN